MQVLNKKPRLSVVIFKIIIFSYIISLSEVVKAAQYTVPDYELTEIEVYDPYEKFNRKVFNFNKALDRTIAKPFTSFYKGAVPKWGRDRVSSFFKNLGTPLIFVNDILQGNQDNSAFTSFWRFIINSTLGIGGLFDIAQATGLHYNKEDFGQTLGYYGAKPGAYLMLPILGPSTMRDFTGTLVDAFIDPMTHILPDKYVVADRVGAALESRYENDEIIDSIFETSLDPYTTTKSLFMQNRNHNIKDSHPVPCYNAHN